MDLTKRDTTDREAEAATAASIIERYRGTLGALATGAQPAEQTASRERQFEVARQVMCQRADVLREPAKR